MTRLAEDRHKRILAQLADEGAVVISDLAAHLGVAEMTVRRDLQILEEQGRLTRVHGGAVSANARFDQRLAANQRGKLRAARKLAEFLPAGGMIYLDGSTTILNLVPHLRALAGLRAVTNNVETFRQLLAQDRIEAMLLGGRLDRRTDNLVGPLARRSVQSLAFDAAFFSARGLSQNLGLTEATIEDAEIKELVASRARAVYLAVDRTKLGVQAAGNWRAEPGPALLATDLDLRDKRLVPFQGMFRQIL